MNIYIHLGIMVIFLLSAWLVLLIYLKMSEQHIHTHTSIENKRSGRLWWNIYPDEGSKNNSAFAFFGFAIEWNLFSRSNNFKIGFALAGDEFDIKFCLGIPWLFSFWVTFRGVPILWKILRNHRMGYGYDTSINFFEGSLWIHIIENDTWGTNYPHIKWLPKWIHYAKASGYSKYPGVGFHISISFDVILLGQRCHDFKKLWDAPIEANIPIEPDNSLGHFYKGEFMLEEHRWWRSYFPWRKKVHRYVDIQVKNPPMHTGKGENSWDLDDDGIFGMGVECETVEEAVKGYQEAVYKDRKKYGSPSSLEKS